MRQLAALAGVSHVTVSRALRGEPSIPESTRERIRALAEKHGYRTNPLVAALMSQLRVAQRRTYQPTIAFLNTWWPQAAWEQHHTYTSQFAGARDRAAELGYQLQPFWLHEPSMSEMRLTQVLRTRRVQGLLIAPMQDPEQPLTLPWDEFAVATIGYSLREPDVHRACHAHFRGMACAMEQLRARGYRRIGYITSRDFEQRVSSLWEANFRLEQQHHFRPRERIEPLVFAKDAEPAAILRWIEATRPDAVIDSLPNVYDILVRAGVRMPAQLGFVHLDLPLRLKQAGVSGIDQLSTMVGAAAAELVITQLTTNRRGPPPHPVTQLIEGMWCDGRTLRPRVKG